MAQPPTVPGKPPLLPPGLRPENPSAIRGGTIYHHPLPGPRSMVYPPIMDGLTFLSHMTRDFGMTPQFSAAGTTGLSTETVDADGTYVEEYSNLIVGATVNTARIGRYGVLPEVESTNLCLQSENFDTTWVEFYGGDIVAADSTVAPDGNTTADTLTDDDGTNALNVYQLITVANDSAVYTFSIFVKKTTAATAYPVLRLRFQGGTEINRYVILNTNTGATAWSGSAGDAKGADSYGDYWRLYLTEANNGTGNTNCYLYVHPAYSTDMVNLVGSAQGSNVFWGAQLEAQAAPTSYIPTTAAAVVRSADVLAYPTSGNMNAAAGTWIFAIRPGSTTGTILCECRTNSPNLNRIHAYWGSAASAGKIVLSNYSGGVETGSGQTSGTYSPNTVYVVALAWGTDDHRLYVDGLEVIADSSGAAPIALGADFRLGMNYASPPQGSYAHCKHELVYNRALSAAEILDVTRWIQVLNGDL